MKVKLIKASEKYKDQIVDMLKEWIDYNNSNTSTNHSPWAIFKNDYHDFDYYVNNLEISKAEDGKVPDSVYFCMDEERNRIVGAVNIRHTLNEKLLKNGGHIGDGIRPSERRKGYATAMIHLALEECKKIGIHRVLMVCSKDNIGSAKSIKNNGGILENEINDNGQIEQRYWIENAIISERLHMRRIIADDRNVKKEIWEDQSKSPYVMYDMPHETDVETVRKRIERWGTCADGMEHIFYAVCIKNSTMIGFISCNFHGDAYDIGYGFKNEFQGMGYARESLKAIIQSMTEYKSKKLTAGTAIKNVPSVRLLTSVGFQLKGKEQVSFYKDEKDRPIYFDGGLFEMMIQ